MKKMLLVLLMITTSIVAQKKINNYKYIIVPNKFEFLKGEDQYQTSSLTKFLFKKYGFTAFLSNEKLPDDAVKNRCLALSGTVKNKISMFATKNVIELKDCYNKVIYTSKEGKSKQKEYKKAYHEAIRGAFKSIEALKYKYIPLEGKEEITVSKTLIKQVVKTKKENKKVKIKKAKYSVLYAQAITDGFQLVNTKPVVVFNVLETNVENVFIIKDKNGILYKNKNTWLAEYYKNGVKTIEKYDVKF